MKHITIQCISPTARKVPNIDEEIHSHSNNPLTFEYPKQITYKMPSPVSTAATTVSTGAIDNRDQPWKKILAAANYTKTAPSAPGEEIVKTGGPCDVLTNFFSA